MPTRMFQGLTSFRSRAAVLALGTVLLFTGLLPAAGPAQAKKVRSCHSFNIDSGFRASHIRRSSKLSCRKARILLKAAYGLGPMKRIGKINGPGRPVYKFRNGWRCGNGAGGASCFNARHTKYNAIFVARGVRRQAVTAFTGA